MLSIRSHLKQHLDQIQLLFALPIISRVDCTGTWNTRMLCVCIDKLVVQGSEWKYYSGAGFIIFGLLIFRYYVLVMKICTKLPNSMLMRNFLLYNALFKLWMSKGWRQGGGIQFWRYIAVANTTPVCYYTIKTGSWSVLRRFAHESKHEKMCQMWYKHAVSSEKIVLAILTLPITATDEEMVWKNYSAPWNTKTFAWHCCKQIVASRMWEECKEK